MRLTELIAEDDKTVVTSLPYDREVAGLTADSRDVRSGYLFAALQGTQMDGRAYIGDAINAGAVAILTQSGDSSEEFDAGVAVITDANPRRRFARMAARFYFPQPKTIAAVTGTNGKTSVVHFAQQIWGAIGCKAAALGTLGVVGPKLGRDFKLTTPDPVELHRTLAELQNLGIEYVACEASSHGLSQYRLDGLKISTGAFTNLSRDHLDYHETMGAYRAAKLRLFEELLPDDGTIVVNVDSEEYGAIAKIADERSLRSITYGLTSGDLHCVSATPAKNGWRIALDVFGASFELDFPLFGGFQIANSLCAAGLVIAGGIDPNAVIPGLAHLNGVPGRMELAAHLDSGAHIFVDYAHTPEALRITLDALRAHTNGRIIVVFGCGGDRDKGKRPEMGDIAAALADAVIVTDDNPRNEDAAAIRQDILGACPSAREIGDRQEAILTGIEMLEPDDALLVAGKGHERGQLVGRKTLPFNDLDAVRTAVCVHEEQQS